MTKPISSPADLPDDLRELLSDMAFWLYKANDGFKPPEALQRTAGWVSRSLAQLARGERAEWPGESVWMIDPPAEP